MEKLPGLVGHGVQGIIFLLFEKTQASILSKTSVIGRKKIPKACDIEGTDIFAPM